MKTNGRQKPAIIEFRRPESDTTKTFYEFRINVECRNYDNFIRFICSVIMKIVIGLNNSCCQVLFPICCFIFNKIRMKLPETTSDT